MDGLLILKKLTEFHSDGELKSSISSEITQTDLYFMESLIDKDIHSWIGDLMDRYWMCTLFLLVFCVSSILCPSGF